MSGSTTREGELVTLVRSLLDDLAGTAITRLDLRHGDLRLTLRRTPGAVTLAPTGPSLGREVGRPAHWRAVTTPLTGIFYTRPSPDDPVYVEVGTDVEPDHVVGLIETMKMFNEVSADVHGVVREMLVENGSLVEAGQVLLYIEPHDGAGAESDTAS